ncbi:putative helicase MOV-10 [Bactrocera oleae]|uniref:putative helicase MOV-10 n=1 Tax=Bactrocera oleae TaxID=104688 RepID=UPI00387E62D9
MCDMFKMSDGFVQFTEINDKDECDNQKNAQSKKLKHHKAEKWEIEAVGQFLFEEYQNLVFGVRTEWLVRKSILRAKFVKYVQNAKTEFRQRLLEANGTYDIGTLLYRTNYLINTKRGSLFYRIKTSTFFEYTNKKLEEFDEKQKNGQSMEFMPNGDEYKISINGDPALIGSLQVDENAPTHELLYEGSLQQQRQQLFQLTNMGCYICQRNFVSPNDFEDHVSSHADESDFEILKHYKKSTTPTFKLSYNICKNSHYFRFNLESTRPNIIIEKLIIVQTRTFYYVNNTRVPYSLGAEDRKDSFFVDSHLFRKGVEQPIVVVFHEESSKQVRNVEQHHFCRIEEFPVVKLNISPCRLPNKITFKPKFKLPQYMPPVEIRRALQTDSIEAPLANLSNEFGDYLRNTKRLTQQNVREVFLKLLQIEDSDTMRDYSSLVQRNVKLRTYENDYIVKLKIPKHIRFENIIFPFDDVIVLPAEEGNAASTSLDDLMKKMEQLNDETAVTQAPAKKKSKKYIGQVECISYGRVTFKCDQKIPSDKMYTILFRPSRMILRYQYRALEQLVAMSPPLLKRFLFPDQILMREMPALNLNFLNKSIYGNPEQLQAIECIVNINDKQSAPYIIFGPPGTGKTSTALEAIYQIYMLQPQSRILITAGSNGACDEIALRLCNALTPNIERQTITRIYSRAYENHADNINETLLEYSNLYADHFLPDVEVLHSYRIVVCTLGLIGRLATGKFGKEKDGSGVFTHIFVDEVAASTEMETLVALTATLSSNSRLVIAGDHRQLGPILNSKRAANMGLEVSLMERLLERDCYRVDEYGNYNRQIQIRLRRNYRSHPEIVKLFSEMFYEGQLLAQAAPDVQQLCRDWHRAPNAEYPIIFHSVFGPEQREKNSTSRYNPLEIQIVMDYVRDLLCFGIKGHKVVQSDIGIITPYKKQYIRIQEELNLRNWYQIETGAVESFQGKEKAIVIISFVRSFTNNLGFLESRNRLNVALSRARSLLILIGNPRTLSINSDFKNIIELCQVQKTLVGASFFDDDGKNPNKCNNESMSKLTKSLEKLNISKENINACGKNGGKSNKARARARKNMANNNKNVAAATTMNEGTTTVNDVLKSNNSSKFKITQPTSAEKQRQTFERLKDLYLTEELSNLVEASSSTSNRRNYNKKGPKSEIDELFEMLPSVPCERTQQSRINDFEIVDPKTGQTLQHDKFRTRLEPLRGKPTTTTPTYQTQATANNATTLKPTGTLPHLTNNNPHKSATFTPSKVLPMNDQHFPAHNISSFSDERKTVPAAATRQKSTPMHSENATTTGANAILGPAVSLGRVEYPTPPRYMQTRTYPPPKPKSSKSKCVIA